MKEDLAPFSKQRFERIKARAEAKGYKVITTWQPGLKHIRLAPIVLDDNTTNVTKEKRS